MTRGSSGLRVFVLRRCEPKESGWIQIGSLPANGEMKMWRGGPASSTTQPNHLSFADGVAFLHFERGQVHVESNQSLAVVDGNAVSFEVKIASQDHFSAVCSANRRAVMNAKIEPRVLIAFYPVEQARRTENS